MKMHSSILKSTWLLLTVLLIFLGRGLPLWLLILLTVLVVAAPILRELLPQSDLDERQVYISHLSGHIAFYVFLALVLLIMIREFIQKGENPAPEWYALLLIPLITKFAVSLYQNYEPRKVAYWIAYGWLGVWSLFILLSHGFSITALIEDLPFLITVGLVILLRKNLLISGALFVLFAVGLTIFFRGWLRFDLYVRLLMYAFVPLPLLVSGLVLVRQSFRRSTDET